MEIVVAGLICFGLGWLTLIAGFVLVRKEYREYKNMHGYMNVNDHYLYVDLRFGKWAWYIRHFPNGNPRNAQTVDASKSDYDTHKEAMDAGVLALGKYAEV